MEKHEKITIPERVEDRLVCYVCDLCGTESRRGGYWAKPPYRVHETTVEIEEGDVFPEDVSVTKRVYHLCPKCFETRLEPWLKEQGATPTTNPDEDA